MKYVPLFILLFAARTASAMPPPTWAQATHDRLQREVEQLAQEERSAPPDRRIALRSAITYRVIAMEQIIRGLARGADGAASTFAGLRISRARHDLDESLGVRGRDAGIPPDRTTADLLKAFCLGAVDNAQTLRTDDASALAPALADVFRPLADGVAARRGSDLELRSHWPLAWTPERPADGPDVVYETAVRVRQRTDDAAQPALLRAVAWLERLDPPATDAEAAFVAAAADYADALARIRLPDRDAAAIAAWLTTAIEAGLGAEGDGPRDGAAIDVLRRDLDERRARLEAVTVVSREREIVTTFIALLDAAPDIRASALPRFDRLCADIARLEVLAEVSGRAALRRERQTAAREARRAQAALLDKLERILEGRAATVDPAFATLLMAHANAVDDLERIAMADTWISASPGISTKDRREIVAYLRSLVRDLGQDRLRAATAERLDAFGARWRAVDPMPYEERLRANPPEAARVTGGLSKQLAEAMRDARAGWLVAWAGPDPAAEDAARAAVDALRDLGASLARLAPLAFEDGREAAGIRLNRWGDWDVPVALVVRRAGDVATRLKLASASAADGAWDDVLGQIERLNRDVPVAAVVALLLERLGPALEPLADGTEGLLQQLLVPPTPSAWGAPWRMDLLAFQHAAIEADVAWTTEQTAAAEAWQTDVRERADRLLAAIDAAPAVRRTPVLPPVR